jgi:hypothetical protein
MWLSSKEPHFTYGRVIDYTFIWREGRHGNSLGLHFIVEFRVPFLSIFKWIDRITIPADNLRILPVLEQLAREGK